MRQIALCVLLALVSTGAAGAGEWKKVGNKSFEISGPIQAGDLGRLQKLDPEMGATVSLNSNGGSFQEGLKLATYFYEKYITTVVKDGDHCYSACAIAFMGGTYTGDEDGAEFPGRSIGPNSKLGFHAPYLEVGEGQYEQALVEGAYDRAIQTVVDVVQYSDVLRLDPADTAELMRAARNDLTFIDTGNSLGNYRITVQGLELPKDLTITMVRSLCSNGWNWSKNYRRDANYTGMDPYAESEGHIRDVGWTAKKGSFKSSGLDMGPARTIVIPILGGSEGTLTWCVVDRALESDWTFAECRGFVRYETLKEAISELRNGVDVEYPCEIPNVVDPLGGGMSTDSSLAQALVPPATPIQDIKQALDQLAASESPIR